MTCTDYARNSYYDRVFDVQYFGRHHVFSRRKMSRGGGGEADAILPDENKMAALYTQIRLHCGLYSFA